MSVPPPPTETLPGEQLAAHRATPSAGGATRSFLHLLKLPESTRTSIFGEILDWMAAPLLLLWPLSVVATFFMARNIADQPFDSALEQKVLLVAQRLEGQRPAEGRAGQEWLVAPGTWLDDTPGYRYQIRAAGGAVLAGDPELPAYEPGRSQGGLRVSIRNGTYHGEEMRIAALLLRSVEKPGDAVVLQVGETTERRENFANDIIRGLIFPQFVVLPIAVALVWVGLARGLRPLENLRARMQLRSPEDLSPLPLQASPEEVAPLLSAFNDLIARLARLIEVQKRFIANAAHQMKTPLAGIRMQAELAMRTEDPSEMRASLRLLMSSSERAAHLLNQLLSLARTESLGQPGTGFVELVLAQRLRQWSHAWADQALAQGHDFGLEIENACEHNLVRMHPILIGEMLSNLVDNALRYTPSGSVITIRLRRDDDRRLVLEVEDNGPGIPAAEQALVFERFYRTLGTQASGSGLGLAIVREIAIRHRLELRLDSPAQPSAGTTDTHDGESCSPSDGGGCRFSMRFPPC